MADLNLDLKDINFKALLKVSLPSWARKLIAVSPMVVIVALFVFISILPKREEIKKLGEEIAVQETEIAKKQSMADRLDELKVKNEMLKKSLKALEDQLPEESEISSLLMQISDLAGEAELQVINWKPGTKRTHPSKIVYEVPVSASMRGSYHRLGRFFSSLTKLDRIVNIADIKLGGAKLEGDEVQLSISFNAVTFTAVKEGRILQ